MTHAVVLIGATRAALPTLGGQLADVDGVAEAWSVTGEWDYVAMLRVRSAEQIAEVYSVTGDLDLVAIVRVRQHEELADVVTRRIAALPGITHTTTMIAFQAYSRHDLDSMWGLGIE